MSDAIEDTEPNDDAVFTEKEIGQKSTEEWRGVDPLVEFVVILTRKHLRHLFGRGVSHEPKVLHHEDGEDRLHSIEGEAFSSLVCDDVGNSAGHAGGFCGSGPVVLAQSDEVWLGSISCYQSAGSTTELKWRGNFQTWGMNQA